MSAESFEPSQAPIELVPVASGPDTDRDFLMESLGRAAEDNLHGILSLAGLASRFPRKLSKILEANAQGYHIYSPEKHMAAKLLLDVERHQLPLTIQPTTREEHWLSRQQIYHEIRRPWNTAPGDTTIYNEYLAKRLCLLALLRIKSKPGDATEVHDLPEKRE